MYIYTHRTETRKKRLLENKIFEKKKKFLAELETGMGNYTV